VTAAAARKNYRTALIAALIALGFLGLAIASFVVAGLDLGWAEPAEAKKAAFALVAFTALLQLVASLFGFLARDGVAATGMGLLAGIWLTVGLTLRDSDPGATSDALGLFLLVAGVAMQVPASAALTSKLVPALVLGTAGVRFFLFGLYHLTSSEAWQNAAGVVGLALAGLAVYAAWAAALEDVTKRTLLPVGRRGTGKEAVQGGFLAQTKQVTKEPGVREQL